MKCVRNLLFGVGTFAALAVGELVSSALSDAAVWSTWSQEDGPEWLHGPTPRGAPAALARHPGIDARVGGDHLGVTQVIGGAQVSEGVFVFGLDDLHLTDDVFTRWRQRQLQCSNGTGHTQGGK